MSRVPALLAVLALGACTRPLTGNEAGFAQALFGPGFDSGAVRVASGFGISPLPPPPEHLRFREAQPREDVCIRDRPRPRKKPPAAFVIGTRMHYLERSYTADAMAGWPNRVRVPHALLLAHELTHIWQWQNRRLTGYSPVRAAIEAWRTTDPYFYRIEPGKPFLAYGYEQQAAMVQDYVCYLLFRPREPHLAELRAVLAPVFPVDRLAPVAGR